MFLVAFSQIVFDSELLSTFYKITELPFLGLNILFFVLFFSVWVKCGKPVLKSDLNNFLRRVINSCKLDKSLILLSLCWVFFILVSIFLIIVIPSASGDAFCYHVVRSVDWVINQSLAHYESADIRVNSFPINSEILYMWVLLFTKKQLFFGAFTFVGYLMFLISGYKIFRYIGYSMRRTLWTFIIISSFASVVVMLSGTETDLIISGLVMTSIYLFVYALREKSDNTALFMAAMAYALAIGVKTPAIICIPAVGGLFMYLSFKYKDKYSLIKLIGFGILNFILFSSYNYVLNFIDYGNFMGEPGVILAHKNIWGFKGACANFIKHMFLLVDFSGIKLFKLNFDTYMQLEKNVIAFFNLSDIPEGMHSGKYYFNTTLIEPGVGCGILSFLLILPCWFISLIVPIFSRSRFTKYQFIFALIFLTNVIVLSYIIVFMTFSTRFITSFVLISAPMLACSYFKSNKNFVKILYILIAVLYLTVISTHLWCRPIFRVINAIKNEGIVQFRSDVICERYDKRLKSLSEWCNIEALMVSKFDDKNYKVLIAPHFSETILYSKIKKLQGYQYDFVNAEHFKNLDIDKYDVIIFPNEGQATTVFDKYTPDKIDYYLEFGNKPQDFLNYPLDLKSETLCYYNSINGTMSKQVGNENEVPIKKVCNLTYNFYVNHPFVLAYKTKRYMFFVNKNKFPEFKP